MSDRNILYIEDEPEFSLAIAMRLKNYGIRVTPAFNGMDGFWKAVTDRPAVILSDLSMPGGEGHYVLARLQDHPLTRDIPFVVITAHRNAALRRNLLNLGAAAYLHKPLVFEELLSELRQHMPVELVANRAALVGGIA